LKVVERWPMFHQLSHAMHRIIATNIVHTASVFRQPAKKKEDRSPRLEKRSTWVAEENAGTQQELASPSPEKGSG